MDLQTYIDDIEEPEAVDKDAFDDGDDREERSVKEPEPTVEKITKLFFVTIAPFAQNKLDRLSRTIIFTLV